MNANKNNYTCKTCIYREYWCLTDDNGTCDEWSDGSEPEPTEDEKRANAGCDEAHRIMVEGREIG